VVLLEKQTESKKKKSENLSDSLRNFGNALEEWEGKDLEEISKSFKNALVSSMSAYKETSNSDFLLCSFILQTILSSVMTKGIMSEMFKVQYKFPKAVISQLGNKIIELGSSVNQPTFPSLLMSILTFAYQNDLIPTLDTT